jgi:predicted N-formylglutamate amidohydrolase
MSSGKRRVARVTTRFTTDSVVVSCEHASNALPPHVGTLGVPGGVMRSHVAWDEGSRELGGIIAHRLGCAHFSGRYSRLLVDLNRSRGTRALIPTELFGTKVPGNRSLGRKEREERIEKYYTPYREAVEAAIAKAVETTGGCVHLSVHTFAPTVGNEVRDVDVGLLYDPKRPLERRLVESMLQSLTAAHVETRPNYPYRGTSDGFTTHCRTVFPKTKYAGLELEVNQRGLQSNRAIWRMGRVLTEAIIAALELQ